MEFALSKRMNYLDQNMKNLSRDNSGNSKKNFFVKDDFDGSKRVIAFGNLSPK